MFSETSKSFAFTKLPLLVWPSIKVTVYLLKLFFDQGVKTHLLLGATCTQGLDAVKIG